MARRSLLQQRVATRSTTRHRPYYHTSSSILLQQAARTSLLQQRAAWTSKYSLRRALYYSAASSYSERRIDLLLQQGAVRTSGADELATERQGRPCYISLLQRRTTRVATATHDESCYSDARRDLLQRRTDELATLVVEYYSGRRVLQSRQLLQRRTTSYYSGTASSNYYSDAELLQCSSRLPTVLTQSHTSGWWNIITAAALFGQIFSGRRFGIGAVELLQWSSRYYSGSVGASFPFSLGSIANFDFGRSPSQILLFLNWYVLTLELSQLSRLSRFDCRRGSTDFGGFWIKNSLWDVP